MTKTVQTILRIVVWVLVLEGISSIWEFVDVAMFGESQRSAVDALAAIFMTNWIDNKIWRNDHGQTDDSGRLV